ncbi:universal stress protein [Streptomyces apocyni]|uniref:universal stress protein n=1 Tax=Streptomyces apocyni TaxID=2654677 RepID=UPI0012E9F14F|nr:universal stress protein [Streptomyces apocyni]
MTRPITVGVDGSLPSQAAADWAAREARLRGLPLRLVQAWERHPFGAASPEPESQRQQHEALRMLQEAEQELRGRYPALPIDSEQIPGIAAEVLLGQAEEAELLVLGSSGHGAIAGFFLGSVGQQVLARAKSPVVSVRPPAQPGGEQDNGEVVVGVQHLEARKPSPLLDFAFSAAAVHGATVRAVHAEDLPSLYAYGLVVYPAEVHDENTPREKELALAEAVKPWRDRYPQVPVVYTVDLAQASGVVLQAAEGAALVVVGRRVHQPTLGMRIGPVAHAVLHHATSPVAVVPHA